MTLAAHRQKSRSFSAECLQLQDEVEMTRLETRSSELILTTHRLMYESRTIGRVHRISIMLENLCSVETEYRSFPWLIVLALLFLGVGLFPIFQDPHPHGVDPQTMCGVGLATLSAILWWTTRTHNLFLESSGAMISMPLQGFGQDRVTSFSDQIHKLQNARYMLVASGNDRESE